MDQKKSIRGNKYQIRLKGTPSQSITDWFGGITIIPQEHNETILVGDFADQSALRGFLDALWDLNFTVLAVERLKDD